MLALGLSLQMLQKKAGWKIIKGNKEFTVTMNDSVFIERLQNMEEAHIFGRTFNELPNLDDEAELDHLLPWNVVL